MGPFSRDLSPRPRCPLRVGRSADIKTPPALCHIAGQRGQRACSPFRVREEARRTNANPPVTAGRPQFPDPSVRPLDPIRSACRVPIVCGCTLVCAGGGARFYCLMARGNRASSSFERLHTYIIIYIYVYIYSAAVDSPAQARYLFCARIS